MELIAEIQNPKTLTMYEDILVENNMSFEAEFPYLTVNKIDQVQGWILDLTVVISQFPRLFEKILPMLVKQNVCFKIPFGIAAHQGLLDADFGYDKLGKVIVIYPESDHQALALAEELVAATRDFKGPKVPSDAYLGGIVYTRYGAQNPVYLREQNGSIGNYIYNEKKELIPDPVDIPFKMPPFVSWIFGRITPLNVVQEPRVFFKKYVPHSVLKSDSKGRVIKAINISNLWHIDWCIIKEGNYAMLSDQAGRDMADRMKWQVELQNELSRCLPVPKVYDYIEKDGNSYLVMQFLKGKSFVEYLAEKFYFQVFKQLKVGDKQEIVDYILQIAQLLRGLHQKQIIHRDVTPANFFRLYTRKMWMIDLELSYSQKRHWPDPPFRMGTPGYMSPEQQAGLPPTVEQDIYGFGALLLTVFTHQAPSRFDPRDVHKLQKAIMHFTGSEALMELITRCLSDNPDERPGMDEIIFILGIFKGNISATSMFQLLGSDTGTNFDLGQIIQSSINTIGSPRMIGQVNLWHSKKQNVRQEVGNMQQEITYDIGFHTGILGPLTFIGKASVYGLDVDKSISTYRNGFQFVQNQLIQMIPGVPPGLYFGAAGVGIAIYYGLQSNLLPKKKEILDVLEQCLTIDTHTCWFSDGAAGVGLAILRSKEYLSETFFHARINCVVSQILEQQGQSGSWVLNRNERKENPTSQYTLSEGDAGVLLFLIDYALSQQDQKVVPAITKGLKALMSASGKKKGYYPDIRADRDNVLTPWLCDGAIGLALVYTRAYQLLQDGQYKIAAESIMGTYPLNINAANNTWGYGLAGIGEVYLEAYKTFQYDLYWKKASCLIAQLVVVSQGDNKDETFWMSGTDHRAHADFISGNTGIANFLLRYHHLKQKNILIPII